METLPITPAVKSDDSIRVRALKWLRETIAVCFWVYLILKTVIFDLDVYLLEHFAPSWAWLIYLKFPLFVGMFAAVWLFTKNSTVVGWFLYVLFYPIIFIVRTTWRLFKTRRWLLIISLAHAIMSLVQFAKYRFIAGAFSFVAVVAILLSTDRFILTFAMIVLLVVLILTYSRRFYYAFKPSMLYQMHSKIVERLVTWNRKAFTPQDDILALPITKMDSNQVQLWTNCLQFQVISNRFCYFLSSKLKQYQRSNISVAANLVALLVLLMLTVVVFAATNVALYKMIPDSYSVSEHPTFFLFCYYSMARIFGQTINEINPVAVVSRALAVMEMIASVSLLGILMSLFLSVKEKQDSEELDRTIALIKRHGTESEGYIRDTYKLSVIDAIAELQRLKAGMITLIVYLSDNIDLE